ncbi:MAG: hypothetical protein EZS28_005420 [Streblomastix strix]|uniref:Uncharacterized protein n=1 Tax=Streblomastix strix TaxID=222440 RepID=A0A5J4WVQ9_9EUKA|nr:MAG: hypothetical protein EZS28_005420 [Streblomastix strix]
MQNSATLFTCEIVADVKRQSSRFKYKTEDDALKAAAISCKRARAKELLKMKVHRQFAPDSQQYFINRLRRLINTTDVPFSMRFLSAYA